MQAPEDGSARASAVLVLLGAGAPLVARSPQGAGDLNSVDVVLLERASTLRRHAGQVAFPGGAADRADADAAATALREAQEEIGLNPGSVQVLAALPTLYIPPSGYVVTPVLAYWESRHDVGLLDSAEVAAVHSVAVADLADPAARFSVRSDSGYTGPAFDIDGLFVWGFTASVLDQVLDLGGWSRNWDAQRFREIPLHQRSGARASGAPVEPSP